MKSVGKPCEGKPHARSDEGAETTLTVSRIADTGRVNLPENRKSCSWNTESRLYSTSRLARLNIAIERMKR